MLDRDEKKFATLEKKEPDEMEVAAQEIKKGKTQEKTAQNAFCLKSFCYHNNLYNYLFLKIEERFQLERLIKR